MPASPTLRNSSDPPLSPPPINTACILSVSPHPSTMHSLKCWEMVLGCASAGNQALSPDPFCSQEYLQVLEIGSHPPFPPTYFNTCVLPMLVPVPYLHPMRPHHLDTNSYPQPLSNPTWVPIYPIFLPLPPQTPDSFPPPKTHRVSPLTPVLPPLCCLGFSLPEGGLRKPASAGALGNSPKGGGGGLGLPLWEPTPNFALIPPPPHPHPSL